ncbi:MAG: DUF111 family protein [Nitrososphaerota archaeon]|nr:DUF111 family protein [Nitrososphaerota archaeon]
MSASAEETSNRKTATANEIGFERDVVAVVETNVDDVSGEILGHAIDRLMAEGAYDATVTPYLGKKGRIGHTVRALCSHDSVDKFAQILVQETGTLGVKTLEYTRLIVPRKIVSVPFEIGRYKGSVNVKIAEINGRLRIKPETSEAKQISDSQKIPLREVLDAIVFASKQVIESQRQV